MEPIGPGSSTMKQKVSSGAKGVLTGVSESALDLAIGLELRKALQAAGVKVVMTRTSQNVDISNAERAKIANDAHAELFIRIHADASPHPAVHGIHVLYPAPTNPSTAAIAASSKRAATIVEDKLIVATGATRLGLDVRADMTGFNWSKVPTIIPEIGFMTNPAEDRRLEDPAYQAKIVTALTRAILSFLGS
jgi:N-acetylmuramoyl-L-alanine amidase